MFTDSLSWGAILTAVILYFTSVACYRIFWHPLAPFPGPKLAAITRYYEAYYDIVQNGQYTNKIASMHEKYGPIIRISPYELHINDPSFFESLFRHEGRWNKYDWAVDASAAKSSIIFTADHDQHKARRQPLNSYFSKPKVLNQLGLIRSHLNKLFKRIEGFQSTGRAIDIGTAISAFQRDVLSNYILGKSHDFLDQEDLGVGHSNFVYAGGKMWRLTKHIRWYGPAMLAIPKDFIIRHSDELTANFVSYGAFVEDETRRLIDLATSSRKDDKTQRTIVHEIIDSGLPPEEKVFSRIWSDVASVNGAGVETTASVLRLVIYHVYTNPKIVERLRVELDDASTQSTFLVDGLFELRNLERLPYLTAVLMEGMRMSPALGTRMQRIAPDRDLIYKGWRIPASTPVGMTALFMHMDKELYPEPNQFNPDRWVDPEARKKAEKTYAPFSRGTRICLGMHLAWAEMYLFLSALVQGFNLDFQGLKADYFEFDSDQFAIGTKGGPILNALVTAR